MVNYITRCCKSQIVWLTIWNLWLYRNQVLNPTYFYCHTDLVLMNAIATKDCILDPTFRHSSPSVFIRDDLMLKTQDLIYSKTWCHLPTRCRYSCDKKQPSSLLRWLNTVFHKMENSRIRLVFLDCYFLMSNKQYRRDVKHGPKGSNLLIEVTQLPLLWQRWRSKMADILVLKPSNSKTITVTPKSYLIK